jgi:hypothetical protein
MALTLCALLIVQESLFLAKRLNLMLSLSTARRLKAAGLAWTPGLHDFFAIPEEAIEKIERSLRGSGIHRVRPAIMETCMGVTFVGITVNDIIEAVEGCL